MHMRTRVEYWHVAATFATSPRCSDHNDDRLELDDAVAFHGDAVVEEGLVCQPTPTCTIHSMADCTKPTRQQNMYKLRDYRGRRRKRTSAMSPGVSFRSTAVVTASEMSTSAPRRLASRRTPASSTSRSTAVPRGISYSSSSSDGEMARAERMPMRRRYVFSVDSYLNHRQLRSRL